jgi:hypothetical protein
MSTYLFLYRLREDFPAGTADTIAASGAFFRGIEPRLADMGNPIFTRTTIGERDGPDDVARPEPAPPASTSPRCMPATRTRA